MASGVEWMNRGRAETKLAKAGRISFADVQPALEAGELILTEGNRRKVLSHQDGKGAPMIPVTYRGQAVAIKRRSRSGDRFGTTSGTFKGFGPLASGLNGNLTTAEYKKLTGPPLAPRGEQSRVITNMRTAIGQNGGQFYVTKTWMDVVDVKGRPFLMAHFKGQNGQKRRDLRGISPQEREQFRKVVRVCVAAYLKTP